MKLYFVRHAIAEQRPPNGDDNPARPLTVEGAERMRQAARGLKRIIDPPDVLLTSPFARAAQTAKILASEFATGAVVNELLAPGFDLAALAALVQPQRKLQRLMLVGHEPDFSALISTLCGGGSLEMKKGAVCRVDVETFAAGRGTLVWLLPPRVLRELGA